MEQRSTERVCIVTGGGSGIGRAIAASQVAAGDRVVIMGRRPERLRTTAAELGERVDWVEVDVSRRESVAPAVEIMLRRSGLRQAVATPVPSATPPPRRDCTGSASAWRASSARRGSL